MRLFPIIFILLASGIFSDEIRLLVDPFKKDSGSGRNLDWIGADMSDSISASLSRLKGIKLLSSDDRSKVLKEIDTVQKLGVEAKDSRGQEIDPFAKFLKANLILNGKYGIQGTNIVVNLKIVNAASSESKPVRVSQKYDPETLSEVYDRLVYGIVSELEKLEAEGISPLVVSEEDRKKLKIKKRYNPTAVEHYYNGRQIAASDPLKALSYFQKAIAIEPKYADAIAQMGAILSSNKKEYDKASAEFEKAESIYTENSEKDTFKYIELLSLIAANYYMQNKYSEALEYYAQARSGLDSLNMSDSASMAYVEYGTAICYSGLNQKSKAMEYFENSKVLFDNYEMNKTVSYANLLYGMAYIQLAEEKFDLALENYKGSYEIYVARNMEKKITTAGILYSIAYIHERQGEKGEAGKYYRKAYLLYQSLGYQGKEKEAVKKGAERNGG